MKFPRNAKIFRGHLDVAPFAGVFFCLIIFLLLLSMVYTPGVVIQLPTVHSDLPGVAGTGPTVAMDQAGSYYFENQTISRTNLQSRLAQLQAKSPQPLTLMMAVDKRASWEKIVSLLELVNAAGIYNTASEMLPPPNCAAPSRNSAK